jgi:hypothetical protein
MFMPPTAVMMMSWMSPDGKSIAGGLIAPDLVIQKITAGHPFRIDAQRPRDIPDDDGLHFFAQIR